MAIPPRLVRAFAEMLDISVCGMGRKVEDVSETQIRVERMMEDGYEVVDMPLPGLMTVVKENQRAAHGVAQRENAREENRGCYN